MGTTTKEAPAMNTKVLLLDDKPEERQRLRSYLAGSGFDVDDADSEPQAISQALQNEYPYVFSSLETLRRCDTERLFFRLRTLNPKLKILIFLEDGWNRFEAEMVRMADGTLFQCALPRRLGDMLSTL